MLPEAIEDFAVWINSQHDVVGGGIVGEGPLGVDKKHVGHPDFLHQAAVEGHALVGVASERQTLVLPVVPQVQGHGEVLKQGRRSLSQHYTGLPGMGLKLFGPSFK